MIVDVEASRSIRLAEVGSVRTMLDRTGERFGLYPTRLAADTVYGAADMLDGLVNDKGMEPHIPLIDKSERLDGTFSRSEFTYDHASDSYTCPAGKLLHRSGWRWRKPDRTNADDTIRYRASKADCDACALKARCCPNTPARNTAQHL